MPLGDVSDGFSPQARAAICSKWSAWLGPWSRSSACPKWVARQRVVCSSTSMLGCFLGCFDVPNMMVLVDCGVDLLIRVVWLVKPGWLIGWLVNWLIG